MPYKTDFTYDPNQDTSLPTTAGVSPIDTAEKSNGFFNAVTGTIGKALDTFLDVAATGAANKLVGTSYPTGQLSPAQLAAQQQAAGIAPAGQVNWKPILIYGGAGLAGLLVLALIVRSSSK